MKRIKAVTVAAVTAALALSMSACVKSSDTTTNAGASGSGSASSRHQLRDRTGQGRLHPQAGHRPVHDHGPGRRRGGGQGTRR